MKINSIPYKAYKVLEHWQPTHVVLPASALANPKDPLFPLFIHVYNLTHRLYSELPLRKNKEKAFIHPINIALDLQKAHIADMTTLCAGLLHDYVEEQLDHFAQEHTIPHNSLGTKKLNAYERQAFTFLEQELLQFCQHNNTPSAPVRDIIATLQLLTRHKRHFYYVYLSKIFTCSDQKRKEGAIQIKLADRTHNILSIECFNEEDRLYQCFKNFFILNNAKKFLLDKYGPGVFEEINPTERLFNKCAKATYDAFLTICTLAAKKGIGDARSMIQLAFKKFAYEKSGLGSVTTADWKERHPLWLFQGIIRKYDARLHQEIKQFQTQKEKEMKYCAVFFADYHFTKEQLQAVLDYKDAYALKEATARLLYLPNYYITRFLCSELTEEGRITRRG